MQVEAAEEALGVDEVLPEEEGLLSEVLPEVGEASEAHQEAEVASAGVLLEAGAVALVVEGEVVVIRLFCMVCSRELGYA